VLNRKDIDKDSYEIYLDRGRVYQDMGNHHFAIQDFNESLKWNPTSLAHYYSGISKLKSKDYLNAEEDFKKALEMPGGEENPGIQDGLGMCYHSLGDHYKSI